MIAAVVPAAGLSRRMGTPKLLLPIDGAPLIVAVVRAFRAGGVDRVVVVAPPPAVPGAAEVAALATAEGADVVVAPAPTLDMRASVALGLARLAAGPALPSAVLVTPGDSPGLDPDLVARLIRRAAEAPDRIVVPRHAGQPGRPALIPWALAATIPDLPPGAGVRALFARHADRVDFLETDDPTVLLDLDVPADYARWTGTGPAT